MVKLAYTIDLGSIFERSAGSSPVARTIPSVLTELERFWQALGFLLSKSSVYRVAFTASVCADDIFIVFFGGSQNPLQYGYVS